MLEINIVGNAPANLAGRLETISDELDRPAMLDGFDFAKEGRTDARGTGSRTRTATQGTRNGPSAYAGGDEGVSRCEAYEFEAKVRLAIAVPVIGEDVAAQDEDDEIASMEIED